MIRILIAHNSRLVSDSLRNVLDKQPDVSVVGCAATEEELSFLLPHANVALVGAKLGNGDIFELLRNIRLTHPDVKVIVIGVDGRPETILRHIEAGANGCVAQNESLKKMVKKVIATRENKALVSPVVAALMMERIAQLSHQQTLNTPLFKQELLEELTPRECEVLDLIGEGYTNKAIANELFIECGTVKNHVHNILSKLEASNRHEAAEIYQASSYSQIALAA